MNKFIYIILLLNCSFISNAQTIFQNLAITKPIGINTQTFSYTGSVQKYIVPNRVTSLQVTAIGAKGGTGGNGQTGGAGANLTTILNVTSGQVLYIVVGGYPGQSSTAKFGFGGNGGIANSSTAFGGAGGGLSGIFTSSSPAVANALIVAGGGGGGAGHGTGTDYTGGNAGNASAGTSSNGNEPSNAQTAYIKNGRYQYGYAATNSSAGIESYAFDNYPANDGTSGSDIYGGNGGTGSIWAGGGGGGAGYYGGGGGAGGGDAEGGGAGGASKSSGAITNYGTANSTGDGSVVITCISNSGLIINYDAGNANSYTGTGTTLTNLLGTGLDGTMSNVSFTNPYFSFNGSSSQISIADDSKFEPGSNDWTMEAWFNSASVTGSAVILGKFNDGGASSAVSYSIRTNAANLYAQFGDGTGTYYNANAYTFSTNTWYQVVFVFKRGNAKTIETFINGSSVGSTTHTLSSLLNSTNPLYIGRYNGGEYAQNFNGKISIVRLYNKALTSQEVLNNFNANKSRFGL